jgi:hypothetical protein
VRQLAPTLTPERGWVVGQSLAHGFGRQRGHQLGKVQDEKTTLLPKWMAAPAPAALR